MTTEQECAFLWRLGGDARSFSVTPIVLELTSSARLAGQGAPEKLLPPPTQHWGSRHTPHLASHTGARDLNPGSSRSPSTRLASRAISAAQTGTLKT